jgi:16S rRNA (cytidine1402-2'-O)-methyltransferase
VLAALAVSGLPVDRFCFEGFLPRQPGPRRAALEDLAGEPRTLVFFEAPHRLADTLADMRQAFGDGRPAALCRELTKTYEEVRRGTLADLAGSGPAKGEITLVVGGAPADGDGAAVEPELLAALVGALESVGTPRKEAIARVAAREHVPKRIVYDAVISAK